MNYSFWRKVIDASVVLLIIGSSYLTGFLVQLELGPMTLVLIMPSLLVLLVAYTHLVLRKGRKYGEFEHSLPYELKKTVLFLSLCSVTYVYYVTGQEIFLVSTVVATVVSLYVFAYRPHK